MTPHYADALVQRYMRSSMAAGADSSESPASSVTKSRSPSVSPQPASSRNTQLGQRASNIIKAAAFDSEDGQDIPQEHSRPSARGAANRTVVAAKQRSQPAQTPPFSGRVSSSPEPGRRSHAAASQATKAAALGAAAAAARRVSSAAAAAGLQHSRVRTARGTANSRVRPPARSLALQELPRGWEAAPLGSGSNRSTGSSPEPAGRMQPQHGPHDSVDGDRRNKPGVPPLAGWQQAGDAAQQPPGRSSSTSSGRMLSPTPPQQQPPPPGSLSPRSSAMLVLQQRVQQQQQKRAASQDLHGTDFQQQHAAEGMHRDNVVAQQLRDITQSAAAAIARARGTSAMAAGVLQQTAAGSGAHRPSTTARGSRPSAGGRPDGGFNRPASPSLPPPNVALAREAALRVSSPPAGGRGAGVSPSPAPRAQDTDSGSDDDAGLRGLLGYGDGTRGAQRSSGKQAQRQQEQAAAAGGEHMGQGWEHEQQLAHLGLAGSDEGGLSTGGRASSGSPDSWQQGSRRLSATGEATAAALSAAATTARRRSSMHDGAASPTDLAAAAVSRKASQALAAAVAVSGVTGSAGQAGGGGPGGSRDSSTTGSSNGSQGGQQGSQGADYPHR